MTNYRVSYEVESDDFDATVQAVYASLYLAQIEGANVKFETIHPASGEVFSFPATQRLIKHLNEQNAPQGEGDWQLETDTKVGED